MKQPDGTYTHHHFTIPAVMLAGLERFIEQGVKPGSFLQAVICNNLTDAVGRADAHNLANLPAYVVYLYNEAPPECWGSRERMDAWLARSWVEAPLSSKALADLLAAGGSS